MLKYRHYFPTFLLTFICLSRRLLVSSELCPPVFGEFECPINFECTFGVCKNAAEQSPLENCSEIQCRPESVCLLGRCFPIEGFPCGRNILVGEKTAHSIVTDCGRRGKCINGKCQTDKCKEVLCEDGEFCRDGKCRKYLGDFCFSDYDCGPLTSASVSLTILTCQANKCEMRKNIDEILLKSLSLKCDPGEILQGDTCVPQDECAQLVCNNGETCLNGFCTPTTIPCGNGSSITDEILICPEEMICHERVCIRDPCIDHCPPDHTCINRGECRLIQGMACIESCASPFECINGVCVKDECRLKICLIGERCEGGFCARIEGRACKTARKDCGEAFKCVDSKCQDNILLRTLDNFSTSSGTKSLLKRIRS